MLGLLVCWSLIKIQSWGFRGIFRITAQFFVFVHSSVASSPLRHPILKACAFSHGMRTGHHFHRFVLRVGSSSCKHGFVLGFRVWVWAERVQGAFCVKFSA